MAPLSNLRSAFRQSFSHSQGSEASSSSKSRSRVSLRHFGRSKKDKHIQADHPNSDSSLDVTKAADVKQTAPQETVTGQQPAEELPLPYTRPYADAIRDLEQYGFGTAASGLDWAGALPWAAGKGWRDVIQYFLSLTPRDAHTKYLLGTGLHPAAQKDYRSTVQLLLDEGADVNLINSSGDTALHVAARAGHKETVRLLLQRCAHGWMKNRDGDTPQKLAGDRGHVGAFLVLQKWLDPGKPVRVERDGNKWYDHLDGGFDSRLGAYEFPLPGGRGDPRPADRHPIIYHPQRDVPVAFRR